MLLLKSSCASYVAHHQLPALEVCARPASSTRSLCGIASLLNLRSARTGSPSLRSPRAGDWQPLTDTTRASEHIWHVEYVTFQEIGTDGIRCPSKKVAMAVALRLFVHRVAPVCAYNTRECLLQQRDTWQRQTMRYENRVQFRMKSVF